jgi:hypothetical protein
MPSLCLSFPAKAAYLVVVVAVSGLSCGPLTVPEPREQQQLLQAPTHVHPAHHLLGPPAHTSFNISTSGREEHWPGVKLAVAWVV